MYLKKTTGYVVGGKGDSTPVAFTQRRSSNAYVVTKKGYVLTQREKRAAQKAANPTNTQLSGDIYYQVTSNAGACKVCLEHNGAIYPTDDAKEGTNMPPFHPNCKCTVHGYSLENPNLDPWKTEIVLWIELMYGTLSLQQKAQCILDYYKWTEFSVEFIADILDSIEGIGHIGQRMEAFFKLLRGERLEQDPTGSSDADSMFELPGVHFEGKIYPLTPLEITLPSDWTHYVEVLAAMLDIDYYLVIAFILHESGGNPSALNTQYSDPMQQAAGLMQVIPYWQSPYQMGGQYYSNYHALIKYAKQSGADINNLFDPLGNITVGMMMLNEQRKLCKDPADMRELVGRQGEGYNSASTTEILYYRDLLAARDGLASWYPEDYYSSRMVG